MLWNGYYITKIQFIDLTAVCCVVVLFLILCVCSNMLGNESPEKLSDCIHQFPIYHRKVFKVLSFVKYTTNFLSIHEEVYTSHKLFNLNALQMTCPALRSS